MADLPAPPMKISVMAHVMAEIPIKLIEAALPKMAVPGSVSLAKSKVPVTNDSIRIPIRKPKSAKRVTINAFFEAATAEGFW